MDLAFHRPYDIHVTVWVSPFIMYRCDLILLLVIKWICDFLAAV